MKLKSDFIIHTADDGLLMISTGGFNGMIKGNNSAAFVIECLRENTTKDAIISKMLEKYSADAEVISADVDKVIETLYKVGAIDE